MPPLQDPKSQIRLLRLLSGGEGEAIECNESFHDLDNAPVYLAISYTWGDRENPRLIYIDGCPRRVRNNCHYALWQARLHYPNSLVWIDSVCINQDDPNEKSCQVAMMGKIFAKATKVLACVGSKADDIEYLVNFSPEFVHQALYIADREQYWTDELTYNLLEPTALSGESLWDQLREKSSEADWHRFGAACRNFAQLPYWNRLWIMQELFMADEVRILCESLNLPWTIMCNLQIFQSRRIAFETDIHSLSSSSKNLVRLRSRPNTASRIPLQVEDSLYALCRSNCEDKRDRIYGTLELFTWNNSKLPLIPDYTLSAFKLAVSVVQCWNQNIITWSARRVLDALGIDMNDKDVTDLVHQRRLPSTVPIDPKQQITFKFGMRCTQLREDAKGRLTCCLRHGNSDLRTSRNEELLSMAHASCSVNKSCSGVIEDTRSQLIYIGDEIAAVVYGLARAGDFLATWDEYDQLCMILRQTKPRVFEIIGQGFILYSYGICRGGNYCRCARHGLKHDMVAKYFDTTLDAEDFLVLLAQDRPVDSEGLWDFDPSARLQRLVTRVSKYSNPTATLAEGETWDDIGGVDESGVEKVIEEDGQDHEYMNS